MRCDLAMRVRVWDASAEKTRRRALPLAGTDGPPDRQPRASPSPPPSGGIALGGAIAAREQGHSIQVEKERSDGTRSTDVNRVHIFDTTLRDGEQSPGISLNTAEKVEIAQQLARLGVDVIEAGFPITSPGDFEAVREIARRVEGPVDLRPGPHPQGRHRRRLGGDQATRSGRESTPSSRPPTSTSSTSCRPIARTSRARPGPPSRWPSPTARTSSSRRWTRPAPTSSSPPRSARSRSRRARPWSTSPTPSATRRRRSTRTTSGACTSWCPALREVEISVHCHDDLGMAVANSYAGAAGRERARSSARSTGSASAPATARWRRS